MPPQPQTAHPTRHRAKRNVSDSEAGYMLLAVVVMAALVLIALSVAAPLISRDLRRDKEVESEHRAQQYTRAVRLYYRKFNGPPPSMEALEKSNNIRFLRKQYIDPLTGKADWRVIHLGQQQTTIKIMGEELSGIATTGIGSPATSTTSTIGATVGLAAGFGGASITTTTPGTGNGTGNGGGTSGTTGTSGSSGGTGIGSSSSSFGSGGNIGPVVGVGSSRTGDSILNPNAQTTYDTWEFWYDPRIEQYYKRSQILGGGGLQVGGGGLGSGGINSTPASSFGQDATSGKSNGTGSGSGGNNGTGTGTGSTGTKPQ